MITWRKRNLAHLFKVCNQATPNITKVKFFSLDICGVSDWIHFLSLLRPRDPGWRNIDGNVWTEWNKPGCQTGTDFNQTNVHLITSVKALIAIEWMSVKFVKSFKAGVAKVWPSNLFLWPIDLFSFEKKTLQKIKLILKISKKCLIFL